MALGNPKEIRQFSADDEFPGKYDSVHAMGRNRPDPEFDVTLPSGEIQFTLLVMLFFIFR